ncbi:MAG: hypothetical protein ACRD97_08080, partial [Nitrososphaeraceae archaeon]
SNATQTANDQIQNILTNVTNNMSYTASNATANATGEAVNEANELINAASSAASNATETAIEQTQNILANVTSNVSNLAASPSSNVTSATMTNYSSSLYQIQFQYPSGWELSEKTSRFDEGTDISVMGFSPSALISILYLNESSIEGIDLQSRLYEYFKLSIDDYEKEYRVIEQPSFATIGNQKAGSYLYTHKDKYEDFAIKYATQVWTTYVGNHGYLLSFTASTDQFDAPYIKQIRDHFLSSIKFLGATDPINSNVPNRFD